MEFVAEIINFALLNSVLFINGLLVSFKFFHKKDKSFSSLLTYSFFFYLVQIISFQVILGIVGLLYLIPLSIIIYLSFILCAVFFGPYFWKKYRSIKVSFKPLPIILFAFLAVFGVTELFNALFQAVWEYDSIAYHLPFAKYWFNEGSINNVLFAAYRGPISYYPGSGELYSLWYIITVGGDYIVNIQNIILFIIMGVCSYDLAKKIGIRSEIAVFFPFIFLHIPIILLQIGAPYNDILFVLAFAYLIYFIIEYIKTKEVINIIPISFAFGLFVGTKFLGITYSIIPIIVLVIALIIYYKKWKLKDYVVNIGFGAICFVLTGGIWYIRNLFLTGNPIFPAELSFFGITLLEGYSNMTEQIFNLTILYNFKSLSDYREFFPDYLFRAGYQIYLLIGAYIATFGLFLYEIIRKKKWKFKFRNLVLPVLFLIVLPIFLYFYISAPYSFAALDANIRYSIVFLFVGALLITFIAEKVKFLRPIFYAGIVLSVIFSILNHLLQGNAFHAPLNFEYIFEYWNLFLPLLITIIYGAIFLLFTFSLKKNQKYFIAVSIITIPLLISLNFPRFYEVREHHKYDVLHEKYPQYEALVDAYEWINNNTTKSDLVAYSGFHFEYPLYGTNLDRNVKYIQVNDCATCTYYDYRNEENTLFAHADKGIWLNNMKEESVKYLILFNQYGFMKYEQEWAESEPDKLIPVFDKNGVKIYEFIPS